MARMTPETLTIAVLMDSMDWFDPRGPEADAQVKIVNRALKFGGRVLLRSAGLRPWYVDAFEKRGFVAKRVGARIPPGSCIDRFVMRLFPELCMIELLT
jgi:betaine lipid synthase